MAAAFVRHENLFNALKDATGLHETIGASVPQFMHPPRASSGSRAVSFFLSFFFLLNRGSNLRWFYVPTA